MRILLKPACQRRLRAELNVGFISDDQRLAARHLQQGADILRMNNLPGGVIRATDKYHLHAVKVISDALQIQLPVVERLHVAAGHAKGFGADTVHPVGRLAVHHRVFTRLTEGADQQLNPFISPTADQHLLRLHACILRIVLDHRFRLTLRVAVQRLLRELKGHRRGIFIGIQPDVAVPAQTTRRLIGRQATDIFAG